MKILYERRIVRVNGSIVGQTQWKRVGPMRTKRQIQMHKRGRRKDMWDYKTEEE